MINSPKISDRLNEFGYKIGVALRDRFSPLCILRIQPHSFLSSLQHVQTKPPAYSSSSSLLNRSHGPLFIVDPLLCIIIDFFGTFINEY